MAQDTPAVSVILPVYRVEDYIGECVESLLAQTFRDFEVVCIDDGSPDASIDVARRLAGDDGRFRFIAQENAGLSAARNRGMDEARGDYLVFLDSDDLYAPEALELLYLSARADDLDYLDFTAHTFYESAHMKRVLNEDYFEQRTPVEGVMSGRALFARYEQLDEYCCPACFHFFKRSLAERAGLRFVEGIVHEDELFSPLLAAYAERAAFLNEPLYLRRMRDASIMNTKRGLRNVEGVLYAARELEAWLAAYLQGDCPAQPSAGIGRASGRPGGEVDRAFASALAERIAMLRWIAVADALTLDPSELEAHAATLEGAELLDFELHVKGGLYAHGKTKAELDWRRLRKAAHMVLDKPIALADKLRDNAGPRRR